jgi:hypothetical protein
MPSVPVDGRRQYDFTTVAIANASLGRMPWDGVQEIFPGRYVVGGTWPTPTKGPDRTPDRVFSSAVAASATPESRPKTAGHALWPNLP